MKLRYATIACLFWVASLACAQVPKVEGWDKCVDRIVQDREATSKDLYQRFEANSQAEPNGSKYQVGDLEKLFAYAMSPVRSKDIDPAPYRRATVDLLRSSDPRKVGLGCQIAGMSGDLSFLPQLGALIGDFRPSLACAIAQMPQAATVKQNAIYQVPSVQALALDAIVQLTSLLFKDKQQFNAWYKDFPNRNKRAWYWSSVWRNRQGVAFWGLRSQKQIDFSADSNQPYFETDVAFQSLDSKIGLQVLLAYNDSAAIEVDLARAMNSDPPLFVYGLSSGPKMAIPQDAIVGYVKQRKLKSELVSMFDKPALTKLARSYWSHSVLKALSLYMELADRDDAIRLAKLQDRWSKSEFFYSSVALVRSKVDPEHGNQVLLQAFRVYPKSRVIAEALAERYFDASVEPIVRYFQSLRRDGLQSFCWKIADLSGKGRKVPIRFFKAVLAGDVEPGKAFPYNCLANLATALNSTLGKEAVPNQAIEAATYRFANASPVTLTEINNLHGEAVAKLKAAMNTAIEKAE